MFRRHRQPELKMIVSTSAEPTAPILRFRLPAFHHHQLLPAPSAAGEDAESRSFSSSTGTGAQVIPLPSSVCGTSESKPGTSGRGDSYDFVVWAEKKRVEKLRQARTGALAGAVEVSSFRHYACGEGGLVLVKEQVKAEFRMREQAMSSAVSPTLRTPRRVGQPQS